VVSNTTPISNLIRIQQLSLLQKIFERVVIPLQVAEELARGKHVLGLAGGSRVEFRLAVSYIHESAA
jgi:predicted nucleic acid-binding protein